ncbi:hypothetical protein SCOR_11020 [Sulfidibacter corallicola]|uniref:Uncharacterized protein n=1 Tax=Sulfidibacter corallicola TaxID=2818388 RepID=A0A8A4TG20_SULCO|nr:hypothetical protein [Sulfidibacter corallicola]QTD48132.1 hypothetical protein J3U87_21310 [Sulfidibacter corallicola]
MGRPAPNWFAELEHLNPDRWYTAPRLAKRVARTSANVRLVLSRRISPTYQSINGELYATWLGADLIRLAKRFVVEKRARDARKARRGTGRRGRPRKIRTE